MKDLEDLEKLIKILLHVYLLKCKKCNQKWHDVVETVDTDYVLCYCSSVYDPVEQQLIIVEFTNAEFVMDLREILIKG